MGHFNWKLNWSSLTSLELGQAHFERDEVSVLSRALNVEILTIRHARRPVIRSGPPSIPQTIRLPHLKRFSLQGTAQFLTVLEAPKLDEFELEFHHVDRDLASVTSFLSRSSCTIRRFTLKSVIWRSVAFNYFQPTLQETEHLELRRQSDLIRYLEALDASPYSGRRERLVHTVLQVRFSHPQSSID